MKVNTRPWNIVATCIRCLETTCKLTSSCFITKCCQTYLEPFLNRKHHHAAAALGCVAHIFTLFKTYITCPGLCVVQLKRQERVNQSEEYISNTFPLCHSIFFIAQRGIWSLLLPLTHRYLLFFLLNKQVQTSEKHSPLFPVYSAL